MVDYSYQPDDYDDTVLFHHSPIVFGLVILLLLIAVAFPLCGYPLLHWQHLATDKKRN